MKNGKGKEDCLHIVEFSWGTKHCRLKILRVVVSGRSTDARLQCQATFFFFFRPTCGLGYPKRDLTFLLVHGLIILCECDCPTRATPHFLRRVSGEKKPMPIDVCLSFTPPNDRGIISQLCMEINPVPTSSSLT